MWFQVGYGRSARRSCEREPARARPHRCLRVNVLMSTLMVVHCVDTEGPLYESATATFERIESIYGISLEPTPANLQAVQDGRLPGAAPDVAAAAAVTFSP